MSNCVTHFTGCACQEERLAALEKENAALLECVKAFGKVTSAASAVVESSATGVSIRMADKIDELDLALNRFESLTPTSQSARAEAVERVVEAARDIACRKPVCFEDCDVRGLCDDLSALENLK